MDHQQLTDLLKRYRLGQCNDMEKSALESWYNTQAAEDVEPLPAIDFHSKQDEVWKRISGAVFSKTTKLYSYGAIAAAVTAMVISVGLIFYGNKSSNISNTKTAIDIVPGKVGATLTLANGEKIRLGDTADGTIATQAGISVSKTADGHLVYKIENPSSGEGQINTLSTTKGETYILVLPDKSKVWLNAASSITFTSNLRSKGVRKVDLSGEAYFEVQKDEKFPFIVVSKGQEVRVLGTRFNVNAYADEPVTATTLLEGAIHISAGVQSKILKPGQQALTTGQSIQIGAADIESVMDWKEGDFYLDRVNFKTAMRKIARWYNIEIFFDPALPDNIESSGYISRSNKLSKVLRLIEKSGQVHFRTEGRKVYVSQ